MNKKLLSVFVVSVLAVATLCLSGCKSGSCTSKTDDSCVKQLSELASCEYIYIYDYTDPDTGIHYLIYFGSNGRAGITPRLNRDMSVMVDDESATEAN